MRNKDKRVEKQEPRITVTRIVLFLVSCFFSLTANAQCAMCRAALEGEGNAKKAEAVNDGIVYLMLIPYILVAAIGYIIFRMYKKKKTN